MARFDVYDYNSPSVPLVIDVQANLLNDLKSCVVIPLVPENIAKNETLPRLKPKLEIQGETYILLTTDIGTIAKASLGKRIANIEQSHRQDIVDALDFLFQGF